MKSSKKILILIPSLEGGGVERIRLILASEFVKKGYCVEFALLKAKGSFLEEVRTKYKVHDLNIEKIRFLPIALLKLVKSVRPDAILASIWPITVMATIGLLFSKHKFTIVLSEHNHLSTQYSNMGFLHNLMMRITMIFSYRLADSVVAVSEGVGADLSKLSFMHQKKIHIIHNPIQKPKKQNSLEQKLAEDLWEKTIEKKIISVGSLKKQKNHKLLIKAFKYVSDEIPSKLMIVGTGKEKDSLLDLAKSLNLQDKIIFTGFQKNVSPLYAASDLFVLSSSYEGFGNVLLEALIHGLPIVSTDCQSGPAEILCNGSYGTLIPTDDVKALSGAMIASLQSTINHSTELKKRAYDFLPDKISSKYLKVLFPNDA
jgi:glycosyltransferase involved in cell wall biosynthesis